MEKMKGIRLVRLLALALMLIAATACGNFKDIKINSCKLGSVSLRGFTAVDAVLDVEIDNPAMAFTISDIDGAVLNEAADTAIVIKGGPVEVSRKSVKTYQVPCTATLGPSMDLMTLINTVSAGNYSGYDLDLVLTVQLKNGISREIKLDDISLSDLLENYQGL